VQGDLQQVQESAAQQTPLVYAPQPEVRALPLTSRIDPPLSPTLPLLLAPPQPIAQRTPEEMGMTQADPSQLDPETAAKLGLKQVGKMDDIKKTRKQYKHGSQVRIPAANTTRLGACS
jgi:hypothetical protein